MIAVVTKKQMKKLKNDPSFERINNENFHKIAKYCFGDQFERLLKAKKTMVEKGKNVSVPAK